jgi:hypothetical protein
MKKESYNKLYIKYKTKKLAKQKGFDNFGRINYERDENGKLFSFSSIDQVILQQWLREKHNIHVEIRADVISGKFSYFYVIVKISNHIIKRDLNMDVDILNNDYNLELENALVKALNMI